MRSNVVVTALLFHLCALVCHASWPPADTIIIDGETIYIEKDVVNEERMDSLIDEGKNDVKSKPVSTHPFGLAILLGGNTTIGTFGTSQRVLEPLNDFANDAKSVKLNITAGLDFSARIWQFPAMSGTMKLEAHAGISSNQVNILCDGLNIDQLLRDSIIRMSFAAEEISLEYLTWLDPDQMFSELDTAIFSVEKKTLSYKTIDVPIKIRLAFAPQKSPTSILLEAGVIKSFVSKNGMKLQNNFLVNNKGEYEIFEATEFKPKDLLRPIFGIGFERKLEPKSEGNDSYLSIGAIANAILPAVSANESSFFYVDIRSFSLSAFARFNF